jgi:hypothetical protein
MATRTQLREPVKTLLWGVLWILGVCLLCYPSITETLYELLLIRGAHVVAGSLVVTHEKEQEDFRGHVYYSDVGVYAYRLPDGREFKTLSKAPTGHLKSQRDVEYLPNNPAVSRVKGDGCYSVMEWLWRKAGLGCLLLALFFSPGIVLLRNAVRDIKRLRTWPVS